VRGFLLLNDKEDTMRAFVATKETQGKRKNDFCFVEEKEMVWFGGECDNEPIDGACGCKRAMCGVKTRMATTTFAFVEYGDEDAIRKSLLQFYQGSGELNYYGVEKTNEIIEQDIAYLRSIQNAISVNSICERRGPNIRVRIPGHKGGTNDR
jgi:hypothetical protein